MDSMPVSAERSQLIDYANKKGPEAMQKYKARENKRSIDGVPGLRSLGEGGR